MCDSRVGCKESGMVVAFLAVVLGPSMLVAVLS